MDRAILGLVFYGQPVFVWTGFLPDVLLIVIVLVVSPHKITTMAFVG